MIAALVALAVALTATAWTTAYALQVALEDADLVAYWSRVADENAWWDTIEAMHETLDALIVMDNRELLECS
jgi:hypothetical protein